MISEMVGSGPLGTVYKAKEAETGLDIALKVIHEPLVDIDAAEETFFEALRRVGRHEASNVLTLVPIRDGERLLTRSLHVTGLTLRKVLRRLIGVSGLKSKRFRPAFFN